MERPIYRVSQINAYVKRMLTQDVLLTNLQLGGEISNFKRHSSGHMYFALKDELAAISAVMFASDAKTLRFFPKEGQKVIARGSISLYEKTGQYQFYVRHMEPDGIGALYQAYEALKQKLAAEGLFDVSHKKKIPSYPQTVVMVTSPTGAVIQDMTQIARRRHPGIRLILIPVMVQGEGAADSIVRGLALADQTEADTVIVGRGGGSIEDLWAFNEEKVARAIVAMRHPVISAVGHETDYTIADFVADLRAPTPSAAAELAIPQVSEILEKLELYRNRMHHALRRRVEGERKILTQMMARGIYRRPWQLLLPIRQGLDMLAERLVGARIQWMKEQREILTQMGLRLTYLDPAHSLQRGYAYITDDQGKILSSIKAMRTGDRICAHLADGQIEARVETIGEDTNGE
ncbi:MAG: exodeoxyribonuclease VII large subunit [Lachnospirales bacterium]